MSFKAKQKGGSNSEQMEKGTSAGEKLTKEKVEALDPLSRILLLDERGGRRRRKGMEDSDQYTDVQTVGEEEAVDTSIMVPLKTRIDDPRSCRDGYILLVKEAFKQSPRGKICLGPLPFLGMFTAFGQQARVPKPPKVQSRWNLVSIPLRREIRTCPLNNVNKYKYAQPRTTAPAHSREYQRPLIPMDPKKKRRILHHFPITGDKMHIFKVLIPSGYFRRKIGGGWICRRWIKRRWPRQLINHTAEEWKAALKKKVKQDKVTDEEFKATFKEVWDGIIGLDKGIVKETFMTMVKEKERQAEKKQDMYDQWDLQVFNHIQRQTQDKINDENYDPHVVTAKQMDLQRKYCKAWQRRKVFLDIIHPDEYNPYEYRDTNMKFSTKRLVDPVKRDWMKERREKQFFGEMVCEKHQARETLKLADWPEPSFKACMAGRVCCDNELGERVHLAAVPEKWASHPVLYNKRWGPEFWHTSFPSGGKCCDGPRPADKKDAPPPPWRGIGIVWDAPQKHQQKLQISEENPWF